MRPRKFLFLKIPCHFGIRISNDMDDVEIRPYGFYATNGLQFVGFRGQNNMERFKVHIFVIPTRNCMKFDMLES